jgi:hypothetical protein
MINLLINEKVYSLSNRPARNKVANEKVSN